MLAIIKGKCNAGENQYENQLYHIFQVINRKGEETNNHKVLENMKENIKDYDELFGKMKEK